MEMERRHAWVANTLPCLLEETLSALSTTASWREALIRDSTTLWDEHHDDWFLRHGDRLPTGDFYSVLCRYLELFHELTVESNDQKWLLNELQVRT